MDESALQELLDVRAIEALIYRGVDRMDANDGAGVAACYLEDGVHVSNGRDILGRQAIAAYMDEMHSGECVGTSHHVSNISPTFDGDRASCLTYLLAMNCYRGHEHEPLVFFARWQDELRKVDGDWLLARRETLGVAGFGYLPGGARPPLAGHPGRVDH